MTEREEMSGEQSSFDTAMSNLEAAGFADWEVQPHRTDLFLSNRSTDSFYEYSGISNPNFLQLVTESIPDEHKDRVLRRRFLELFFSPAFYRSAYYTTANSLPGFLDKAEKNKKIRKDFGVFIRHLLDKGWTVWKDPDNKRDALTAACDVMQVDGMYELFGRKVNNLIGYLQSGKDKEPVAVLRENHRWNPKNVDTLLRNEDAGILDRIDKIEALNIYKVLDNPELTLLFKQFISRERSWPEKLDFFDKVAMVRRLPAVRKADFDRGLFVMHAKRVAARSGYTESGVLQSIYALPPLARERLSWNLAREMSDFDRDSFRMRLSEHFNYFDRNESWEKELAKIRRRESEFSPLVSLGIAKSVGFEIEYPAPNSDNAEIFACFGYKKGLAQMNCQEVSPGPFWAPETAVAVFEKFTEAGIIDLIKKGSMTYHFNIGLRDETGLNILIRAMHLTGAAKDETKVFVNPQLRIAQKNHGFGDYVEAKAFNVLRDHEFKWNMLSATYLAWALGASQDYYLIAKDEARKKLNDIWYGYTSTLGMGLEKSGLGGYLETPSNSKIEVQMVLEQLKFIFSFPGARYGELSNITPQLNDKIIPVRVAGRDYPNLAAFARQQTDEAVSKVVKIADEIESQAIDDIRGIEKRRGKSKAEAIKMFVRKYHYGPLMLKYNLTEEQVFAKVRALLF